MAVDYASDMARKKKKQRDKKNFTDPFAPSNQRYTDYLSKLSQRWQGVSNQRAARAGGNNVGTQTTSSNAMPTANPGDPWSSAAATPNDAWSQYLSNQYGYQVDPRFAAFMATNPTASGPSAPTQPGISPGITPGGLLDPTGGMFGGQPGTSAGEVDQGRRGTADGSNNTTGPGSAADGTERTDRWYWENPQSGIGSIFQNLGWGTDIRDPFLRQMNEIASGMPDLFMYMNPQSGTDSSNLDVLGFMDWMTNYTQGMNTPGGNPAGFNQGDVYSLLTDLASGDVNGTLRWFTSDNPNASEVADRISNMISALGATGLSPSTVQAMQGMLNQMLYDYSIYYPTADPGSAAKFAQYLMQSGFLDYFYG